MRMQESAVRKLLAQIRESCSYEHIDAAEQMIGGNALVEMKLVEEPRLVRRLPSHHRPPPSPTLATESLFAGALNGVLQHNRPEAGYVVSNGWLREFVCLPWPAPLLDSTDRSD